MRILFITSTRIGDAVLSTGLLDHLLRRHPEARITIACGIVAEGIFARMPGLERIIPLTKKRWSLHWPELWWKVAFRRWDLVVDLRGSAMAWLLWTRSRAVMRGGRRPGHRIQYLAEALGVSPAPRPVVWFDAGDAARAGAALPHGPCLILGPTANWHVKTWPAERFVELVQRLTGPRGLLPGAHVAILGGPGAQERRMAEPVLAALPGAVDLVGRLSLPEVAAVLSRAALYVGNDSGLMHIAAATGVPTLGLFGPTPASEYGPVGARAASVLADGRPAVTPMDRLEVEAVVEAATRLLAPVPA
ncbi:glycosyltransferase family 9 protein [Roseococcus sp. SYP-B2431]|nr:glycosyltransferase family 9 protein [Roseococcus sp. SYP-B2431]TCH97458.1 glycosyltransferase family 9 protein [Roseococcus sp. SYP-B2431]